MFDNAVARYREFLDLLKLKAPDDPRLKGFVVADLPRMNQDQVNAHEANKYARR